MPRLALRSFSTLVQNQAAAVQAGASGLVDFSRGAILRAVAEAVAGLVLWLQGLIQYVLTLTRATTSTGTDLDSWVYDYGVTRLAATTSSGQVTFSRFTATAAAVIPVGTKVQTGDGSQRFTVTLDALHPSYSAAANGYLLPAAVVSLAVPVQAVIPGTGANVVVGAVSQIVSAITYVDTVTNVAAFTNGAEAETDAQLRNRFLIYIASLSRATKTAVGSAVVSLALGLQYAIVENEQYDGTPDAGYFYVVVDDGSGAPPASTLTNAFVAIDAVRALGVRFGVFAPVVVNVSVSMTVAVGQGYTATVVKGIVGEKLARFINTLPLGAPLDVNRLAAVALGASPGVTKVSNVLLNGGAADVVTSAKQLIKISAPTVN